MCCNSDIDRSLIGGGSTFSSIVSSTFSSISSCRSIVEVSIATLLSREGMHGCSNRYTIAIRLVGVHAVLSVVVVSK